MFDPTELEIPIIQAPMAGGPATVELAAAVSGVGGLGFLAAGYKSPETLDAQLSRLRDLTGAPFGVNLFVPQPSPPVAGVAAYRAELAAEAEHYGVALPEPDPTDDDQWAAKIELLLQRSVPVVSFTFGAPPREVVDQFHGRGTCVITTVTDPTEAHTALTHGSDVLCVQGPEAGGHAGTHSPTAEPGTATLPELLAAIRHMTDVPLLAAGGISTGSDIAVALRSGAQAVQLGTAYLRTPESGANDTHKEALTDPAYTTTVMTRAFSGRPARGLHNRFIAAHDATAPAAYPLVNQLTKPLRAAAAAAGDATGLHLWAGTGYRNSSTVPAGSLTRQLWEAAQPVYPHDHAAQ